MRKTANNKIYIDIIEGEDRRLKFSEKLAATINNGIGTFHFQVIQMFLLFFYTDVMKISPVFVAGLFLIVRIIDAFLTPAFGIVVDRITTPWGKYKPWVIGIGLGVGIFGWLTFTSFNLNPTESWYMLLSHMVFTVYLCRLVKHLDLHWDLPLQNELMIEYQWGKLVILQSCWELLLHQQEYNLSIKF